MKSRPVLDDEADDPDEQGKPNAAKQRSLRQILAHRIVHSVSGIPNEVPDAAEKVVEQRPGEQEKDQLAGERPINGRDGVKCGRADGQRDEIPGEQEGAGVERDPGDAMRDRHHHREKRLVDLQVGRKRAAVGDANCVDLRLSHKHPPAELETFQ